ESLEGQCPLCSSAAREPFLSAPDVSYGFPGAFHVVRCRDCEMLYTHPRLSTEELERAYPREYTAHAADRALRRSARAGDDDVWDRLPEIGQKRLLDVGCGGGAYLLRQRQRGWQVQGVDPSPTAVQAAREHGLDVV